MKEILGFNLSELADVVKAQKADNDKFIKHIKMIKNINLDRQAQALHEEFTAKIDCLECGNCCRGLGPRLIYRDIENMARDQRMKPEQFMELYIRRDEDGDLIFKNMPCPFLNDDNHCLIYEKRPKACLEYPHTDHKKFVQILAMTFKNSAYCPIAYLVMESLKKGFDYKRE